MVFPVNDQPKRLVVIAHAPSANTQRLRDALLDGIGEVEGVQVECLAPLDTGPEPILEADGVLLSTPENLGYMSGALKDFFDRIYYPCLEETQGLPYALQVRAGQDGAGTVAGVERIVTGLRWRAVAEPLVCRGEFREEFVDQCRELGETFATALAMGVV